MKQVVQLIWFKRDLRLFDHAVLSEASARGPILPLVIVEPEYWQLPDTSARQWEFWRGCICELGEEIQKQGGRLMIRKGAAPALLEEIRQREGLFDLWSHEETGNGWTFRRDQEVRCWAKKHGIEWRERRQFGVERGRGQGRDKWAKRWDEMMGLSTQPIPQVIWVGAAKSDPLPTCAQLNLLPDGLTHPQKPGRLAGLELLNTFLQQRGRQYTWEMSSPVTAEQACSRLSPYLAYGVLSIREVTQAAQRRAEQVRKEGAPGYGAWLSSIRSFMARLHWHCHFIQKLESEPEIEWQPFAKIYVGMRPQPGNQAHLQAWSEGRTGYPWMDAAMRYLNAHGWINFRMRAMLMSFATYDLWLSWQEAGTILARKFVDYEPGIHWSQCQMQAGETGINTIRVYSPTKQSHDQDPTGDFIRTWVPELAGVAGVMVHEPWQMQELRLSLCPDYPPPLVDHKTAAKRAKDEIFSRRKLAVAREEARGVYLRHGSRSGSRKRHISKKRPTHPPRVSPQLMLDL